MESTCTEEKKEGLIEFYDSFSDMFEFFSSNTTIHGTIRLTCSKTNKMKTTFWVLLFIATFGMMYWQFGLMTNQYWSYPTSTTLTVQSKLNTFPAVTICNLNPYRFNQVNEYIKQLDHIAQETLYTLYRYNASFTSKEDLEVVDLDELLNSTINDINGSFSLNPNIALVKLQENGQEPADPEQKSYKLGFKLCNSTGGDCYYRSFWSGVDALHEWYKFHFMNIMSDIPLVLPITKVTILKNFILTCDYSGNSCNESDYIHFHHPTYGNCFTLNSQGENRKWTSALPGKQFGLSLIVKTEQNDNMPLLSTAAGARIMVHDPLHPPLLEHEGFDIWPGTETSISIGLDEVTRLGGVYSDCTTDGSEVGFNILYNTSYTLQACLHSCFQYKMIELCGCGYYFFPIAPGMEYCDYNKYPGWGHCFYRLYDGLLNHSLSCFTACPKQCRETIYHMSAGTARWPSPNSKNWVIPLLSWQEKYNITSNSSDISKISLYFKEQSLRSFDDVPAMPLTLLLSNMGSQWSLWFGSSVLSVAEMAELVFDIAVMSGIIAYKWQKKKAAKVEEK
ncbi:amiloride-sensitive sodium channel subunit delta [Pelobates cultripes]|uniref:Amiloride-sensitive sodium channel subunit delta n=1 Tax=Pelobates cultripes TaxID=61616 RepID=A0AAD1WP05_PELCU|nr:amiloride-sensitive sodium channel subunit delta [Pelobates cultripes]